MRYIVVHGHFYQPPRENPWTERIGREAGAHPFQNWNARIQRECYAPNRAARILDHDQRIASIVNNYEGISFNVGPTLLDWMKRRDPDTIEALVAADRESRRRLGHGNAMAQAYSHPILPLLDRRDKMTQVRWGQAHFEQLYGRPAEGMWLPETAADHETLDVLAEAGIRYTVLAPWQLTEFRDDSGWRRPEEPGDRGRPYRVATGDGREITVFFYDGGISQRVAFERLLDSGAHFAEALRSTAAALPEDSPLLPIATDGETYGHHHRHGEMALAFALQELADDPEVVLTNFSAFLDAHPARMEAKILSPGSWSCSHGVERWRSDCGCSTGGESGWNQAWRAPLYEGLSLLRRALADLFEAEGRAVFRDPWAARDAYIRVLLDPAVETRRHFLGEHARDASSPETIWRLLEMERHALLMFTSCGWFFHDLAGIETRQVLRYAAKAIELAGRDLPRTPQKRFLEILSTARTNALPHRSGSELFQVEVAATRVDASRIAAEAVFVKRLGIAGQQPEPSPVYHTQVEFSREGEAGKVTVFHQRTEETTVFDYELVRDDRPELLVRLERAGAPRAWHAPIPGILPDDVPHRTLHVEDLDPEVREQIVDRFLRRVEEQTVNRLREILAEREAVVRFLERSGTRPTPSLGRILQVVWRHDLLEELERLVEDPQAQQDWVQRLRSFRSLGLDREDEPLARALEPLLDRAARNLAEAPQDPERLRVLAGLVQTAERLDPRPDLWATQNRVFRIAADPGSPVGGGAWDELLRQLEFGPLGPASGGAPA